MISNLYTLYFYFILSSKFVVGLHSALLVSMIVLVIGAIMSYITGIKAKKAVVMDSEKDSMK